MSAAIRRWFDKLTCRDSPVTACGRLTLQQQAADVGAALLAAEEMTAILRPALDMVHRAERHITSLEIAVPPESGKTLAEIGFLTAISVERLGHLIAGAKASAEEREALMAALPDWRP